MKRIIIIALGVFAIATANAQKISYSGSLTALKGTTAINYEFTYNDMGVGKMTEPDYINTNVSEANEKTPGKGDVWLADWENTKKNVFPAQFKELFAKYGKIKASDEPQKYKMIVNTDFIEPGFNAIAVRRDAIVNLSIKIVETENPENVVATVKIEKSPGSTFWGTDVTMASRVGEAYAKAGKDFGALVYKYCKK